MEPTSNLLARAGRSASGPPRLSALRMDATRRRFSIAAARSAPSTYQRSRARSASRLGKAGLDGHINAVKLLAHACMQAGMEVILAGFKQTPAQLVETALQEDADLLAISSLAGAHMTIAREVITMLDRARS